MASIKERFAVAAKEQAAAITKKQEPTETPKAPTKQEQRHSGAIKTLLVDLDPKIKDRLHKAHLSQDRTERAIAAEAIEQWLDDNNF